MSTREPEYAQHLNAVWRDGPFFALIVPTPDDALFYEQLVTEQVAPNRFRLLCIPFFLYGVSLGDVIEGDPFAELGVFTVVERSGRSTYRVHFPQEALVRHLDKAHHCLHDIEGMGGLIESYHNGYWSVDAADEIIARQVEEYLTQGEEQGYWNYEAGHRSWEVDSSQPMILRGPSEPCT